MTELAPVTLPVRSDASGTISVATSSGVVKRPVAKPPIPAVTEAQPDAVADELNERPRKRFDFATPTVQLTEPLLQ